MLARLSEAMLQLRPVTLMFQHGLQALSCEVKTSLPKGMCGLQALSCEVEISLAKEMLGFKTKNGNR
jgi:hypothetical protein